MRVTVVGNSRCDFCPSFAVVSCLENVWAEVVELVAVDGDVGSAPGVWRRLDDADEAPLAEFFRSDVSPVFTAVARDMYKTVVAAGPDESFLNWRFGDREDRAVILNAGVVLRQRAAG